MKAFPSLRAEAWAQCSQQGLRVTDAGLPRLKYLRCLPPPPQASQMLGCLVPCLALPVQAELGDRCWDLWVIPQGSSQNPAQGLQGDRHRVWEDVGASCGHRVTRKEQESSSTAL